MHARGGDLLHLLSHCRLQGVLNDTHLHGSLQALTGLGVQGGQIAAIREVLFVPREDALRQTRQHMSAACTNGFQQGPRNKATIHQDQHAWFERRQHPSRQALFGGRAGSEDDLDNRVGSSFDQVEAAHLRVGTATLAVADAAKVGSVLRRVIDVFQGAIHRHQAQAKGEGSRRLGLSQRHTAQLKEGAQQPHAELFASIGPSGTCGWRLGFLFTQPALDTTEFEEDGSQAVPQIQVPPDEHPDHQDQGQFACACGLATEALHEGFDALTGIELFHERPRKPVTELVRALHVRYSKGHEEFPFDRLFHVFFFSMSDLKLLFHLFKRYWPQGPQPRSTPPLPLRDNPRCGTKPTPERTSTFLGAYASTFLLTLTNPSTILSFAAIFAGLGVGTTGNSILSAILVVLGVFLGSTLWWLILTGGISLLRNKFTPQWLLWINRLSGVILALFGLIALLSLHW